MNSATGIFTVTDPGIYLLHFQAVGGINEASRFYCTIHVDNKVSEKEQHDYMKYEMDLARSQSNAYIWPYQNNTTRKWGC